MTENTKARRRLHPDEVMTQVDLCSVRLTQALSAAAVTAGVPLLEGEAVRPQLSVSFGGQTLAVHRVVIALKVGTPPLPGETLKLLILSLRSVRLNQALSAAAATAGVPLLQGVAMRPQLSVNVGKQTLLIQYTATVLKVGTPPL